MPRRRNILAAVLAAMATGAAGYLAVKRANEQRAAERAPVSSTTRSGRRAALIGLGTRTGGSYAAHRARRVFASAERREELDRSFELRTAEQVADALGQMKGALMKIGQMASFLDQGLPEPLRDALAGLRTAAPPMSGELAAQVIERELGAAPDAIFEEWDEIPIAAASIGQVHRALTRHGQAVAVKVQYPGVDEAIRADLANAGLLFAGLGKMFDGLDPGPILDEIRSRVVEELDYEREAENQRLFAEYYRDHPFISVPDVVGELSTARVLTSDLADGAPFAELHSWSQEQRDLAAECIYRFVFRSLYRLHAFNGDPHPGNYLFRPDGHVTFLDFGLVKRFTPDEIVVFERMIRAMAIGHDVAAYRTIIEEIGMLAPGLPFTDEEVEAYFAHFYQPILTDEVRTFTAEYASNTIRRYFDPGGEFAPIIKQANLPPSFVIIQRINLGLFAILGDLHATANWRRIAEELWPFVDGPPSTPMGEAEAAWLASRVT